MPEVRTGTNERGLSTSSLVAGIASLIMLLIFLTPIGRGSLLAVGAAIGVTGIVLGVLALRKRQLKGAAISGIIMGAVGTLIPIAIYAFALLFIGAFLA